MFSKQDAASARQGVALMTGLDFHHLGIACADIEKARAFVCGLHEVESDSGIVYDAKQDIHLCLLGVKGGVRLELVAGPKVEHLLAKGMSYYHVCYEVSGLEDEIERLTPLGCMPVLGPVEAVLFAGRRIVFLMTPLGLVELLEKAS